MTDFLTYLISGLAVGASFALIGSGFVVVHRVTHVVNFTQGTLGVFAAMLASKLIVGGLPHGVGEILAVLAAGAVGLAFGAITLARRNTPPLVALLVTIGLVFIGEAVNILLFGSTPAASVPLLSGVLELGGGKFELQRLLVIVATVVVFAVLVLFFRFTDLGRAMTATASNPRAARLVGISLRRMGLVSFAIGGLLGGIAGVLLGPSQQLAPVSDLGLAVSGFSAAVFGGLSSPLLTLAGGLILGVAGTMLQGYNIGSYQIALSLLLMVVIMIFRAKSLNRHEEAK